MGPAGPRPALRPCALEEPHRTNGGWAGGWIHCKGGARAMACTCPSVERDPLKQRGCRPVVVFKPMHMIAHVQQTPTGTRVSLCHYVYRAVPGVSFFSRSAYRAIGTAAAVRLTAPAGNTGRPAGWYPTAHYPGNCSAQPSPIAAHEESPNRNTLHRRLCGASNPIYSDIAGPWPRQSN